MEHVLVSACLLGQKVRYDGSDKLCQVKILQRWRDEGRVMPLCPEVSGGFPTPRPPAEISAGGGGLNVLLKRARVIDISGVDVTNGFLAGAAVALELVKANNIRVAILKEGSPSCGSTYTYDGTFQGGVTDKPGVTAALLRENGVFVFSEFELLEAELKILQIEGGN